MDSNDLPTVELGMEKIAEAQTAEAIRSLISPMVAAYTAWITQQATIELVDPARSETAKDLLHRATIINQRIAAGLQALDDPDVLTAFRMANRSISTAIRQRGIYNSDRCKMCSHRRGIPTGDFGKFYGSCTRWR